MPSKPRDDNPADKDEQQTPVQGRRRGPSERHRNAGRHLDSGTSETRPVASRPDAAEQASEDD
jgi:hypothetical protein